MPEQSDPGPDPDPVAPEPTAAELRRRARRRRELDELFGDVLPGITRDETGPDGSGRGDRGGAGGRDGWYAENRPPHHG